MPTFLLDTPDLLPLPSLQAYTTVSVLLLSCSVYYAFQVTSEPDWKLNATISVGVTLEPGEGVLKATSAEGSLSGLMLSNETSLQLGLLLDNPLIVRLIDVLYLMLHEPLCIWTLINMAYCSLILFGKLVQRIVFGDLRVSEQQHLKDRFWNFVFYKFIFIFGVLNVQFMDEVVLWCTWFSMLGFLTLFAQLCRDRFEYLSFSSSTPKWPHLRLLLLLMAILASSLFLLGLCILVGIHSGINTFAFMAAETCLVMIRTCFVLTRYGIHLWDLQHQGVWENRTTYSYYSELCFELSGLVIDLLHHIHMLIWGNIILSMASLVILMQLRSIFYEIRRRIGKHQNYLQVVYLMETNFSMATQEELDKNSDGCAICWDRMDTARKLPCGHLFHNTCLRSWLEQDTSCPTCRTSLKARRGVDTNSTSDETTANTNLEAHFFHFDGSRYASWLPSVSVQVSRPSGNATVTRLVWGRRIDVTEMTSSSFSSSTSVQTSTPVAAPPPPTNLTSMGIQVQEWFPHVPLTLILQDLRVTHSIEVTMDNILDGRIQVPSSSRTSKSEMDSSQELTEDEASSNPITCSSSCSFVS